MVSINIWHIILIPLFSVTCIVQIQALNIFPKNNNDLELVTLIYQNKETRDLMKSGTNYIIICSHETIYISQQNIPETLHGYIIFVSVYLRNIFVAHFKIFNNQIFLNIYKSSLFKITKWAINSILNILGYKVHYISCGYLNEIIHIFTSIIYKIRIFLSQNIFYIG